jgi:hypothetical protein
MKRNYVLFAFFLGAYVTVVADVAAQTTPTADPPTPRLADASPLSSINPPTTDQFTRLCANTADPADCGKRIEAQQLKQPSAASIVRREGKLLAVTVPGEPPFIFEDVDGEAGPNISFYSYSAPADALVLFRARADKIEYVLIHRPTASVTEIPNEPRFNSDGRYFVTADFCKDGCENRLSVWRIERRGAARERVFAPRVAWSDADASWGSPRRLVVDITEAGRSSSINLDLNDPRWSILLP